ncbi:MAG: MBL fold metallo-hydrolase [Rhizobiaceae bacterium]|nr:MBL fold metallo-hydrolase [Rhizobiaceae bacterium]
MSKSTQKEFSITFWGTRGTLATPDAQCNRAGGNTVCIEVRCGEQTIICDAGTGIRLLGSKIVSENKHKNLHLLLSHAHYDHIEGIPFFSPLFSKDITVDIWCGKLDGSSDTKKAVEGFMRRPYFPVGPDIFGEKTNYHLLKEKETIQISDEIRVETIPLVHPGGATAYRINYDGRSFAYVTDTEHTPGKTNQLIVDFISGAEVFVYDASLTDEELPDFVGYGHSTWQEGLRLAKLAKVKQYFAFHHMPFRNDSDLDRFEKHIAKSLPGSGIARETQTIFI